jgi:hypothetical protein
MVQGGWTPPRHHAVFDDHLTKLYATAESQLQSYVAALAEGKRKAALPSDGKKMENGHPFFGKHIYRLRAPLTAIDPIGP